MKKLILLCLLVTIGAGFYWSKTRSSHPSVNSREEKIAESIGMQLDIATDNHFKSSDKASNSHTKIYRISRQISDTVYILIYGANEESEFKKIESVAGAILTNTPGIRQVNIEYYSTRPTGKDTNSQKAIRSFKTSIN
ncbi:hypothetical protein [Undibacterium fentianense]|uniref:Uncharacterized protein n=1 Tax=Undibacterium fentianense TaxID=2828728 RepID=A0A941IED3_9BURK|nr:hypothetical protein [Undibacterium fentianense]MBR7800973.1 hypothetical protein [Undibacterium fentianense]